MNKENKNWKDKESWLDEKALDDVTRKVFEIIDTYYVDHQAEDVEEAIHLYAKYYADQRC